MRNRTQTARGKGLLIILSAPSGTGKTTVIERLLAKDSNLRRSVSATTRKRRRGERDGRDYFFFTKGKFQRKIRAGAFLEWANVFGHFYGTPKDPVNAWQRASRDVVLVIDVKGARKVMRRRKTFSVFLKPPSIRELRRRLNARMTDAENIQHMRLAQARDEMAAAGHYDLVLINKDLNRTIARLAHAISQRRIRG